ncbi:MAG: hypothetical protein CMM50_06145 [Rhodospirillaceae bacterium]|nr:hypothetical protein [Rhodospirillaceae bacterium]
MSEAASFAAAPPAITTQAELDHLTANRPASAPEQHLTPDGPDAGQVRQQVDAMAENRIAHLQNRLQHVREGFERDYAFGQVQNRAQTDFERCR